MKQPKSAKLKPSKPESKPIRVIHKVAVLTVLAGAAASVGFTLHTGQNNKSILLIGMFVGWVLAPYIAMLLINTVAVRKSEAERLALYCVMIFITLGSLVMYSGLWSPPDVKPAFAFLIVPCLSWFTLGVSFLAATFSPNKY